jgi:hypothetical protein
MYPDIENQNEPEFLLQNESMTGNYSSSDWNANPDAQKIAAFISVVEEETVTISNTQWARTIAEVLIRRKEVWDLLAEL